MSGSSPACYLCYLEILSGKKFCLARAGNRRHRNVDETLLNGLFPAQRYLSPGAGIAFGAAGRELIDFIDRTSGRLMQDDLSFFGFRVPRLQFQQ